MATTGRSGRPTGAAGRAPRGGRSGASRQRRSRAAPPARAGATATARSRANLTARAAILAVALASVALALALPFKVWVGQRGQIDALQSQTKAQAHRVQQLRTQQQRWSDPAYVEQQARVRLHYAMPGETTFVVLGKAGGRHKTARKAAPTTSLSGPWYSRLWQSVEAAGKGAHTTS